MSTAASSKANSVRVRTRRSRPPGHAAQMRFVAITLTPIMLLFFVFAFLPIGISIFLSFYRYSPLDMNSPFIGIRNYTFAFATDLTYQKSLFNTFKYVLLSVPLNIVISLPIAIALNRITHFKALFRAIYFVPAITTIVAVSLVWVYIFDPQAGLLNALLGALGLPKHSWLGEPQTALYSVMVVAVWQDLGYNIIVFLAGLQTIPRTFYEAAEVDGADNWQKFRHITVPLLSRTTLLVVVLTTISYMQVFIPMQVMTHGGPLNSTRTIVLHIWDQAFQYLKMGYASALSVVLMLMLGLIALIQFKTIRSDWEY